MTFHLARLHASQTLLALALVICVGCQSDRHHQVEYHELQRVLAPGSWLGYEYVGHTEDRAYIAVWKGGGSILGGGDHVYSVALSDLPPEVLSTVRAGRNPWPWRFARSESAP